MMPDARQTLVAAVLRGARAAGVPDSAELLLAVSGGPDSMALLHGAAAAIETGAVAWQLTVAHLDHALRDESADDAAFVADTAGRLGLRCEVRRQDIAELARRRGLSIEEAGREARYAFFDQVAETDALIATAHTADDSA